MDRDGRHQRHERSPVSYSTGAYMGGGVLVPAPPPVQPNLIFDDGIFCRFTIFFFFQNI